MSELIHVVKNHHQQKNILPKADKIITHITKGTASQISNIKRKLWHHISKMSMLTKLITAVIF